MTIKKIFNSTFKLFAILLTCFFCSCDELSEVIDQHNRRWPFMPETANEGWKYVESTWINESGTLILETKGLPEDEVIVITPSNPFFQKFITIIYNGEVSIHSMNGGWFWGVNPWNNDIPLEGGYLHLVKAHSSKEMTVDFWLKPNSRCI